MPPHVSYEQVMRNRRYLQRSVGSAYGAVSAAANGGGLMAGPSSFTSKLDDLGSNFSNMGDYPYFSNATGAAQSSSFHSTNYLSAKRFRFAAASGATSGVYPLNSSVTSNILKTSPTSYQDTYDPPLLDPLDDIVGDLPLADDHDNSTPATQ